MRRVIVDYKKLNNEILSLLVEKFPDGYGDDDIISFKNMHNETVEAVEVRTDDTIYLVKVSTKLASSMGSFVDDDEDEDFTATDEISSDKLDIPEDDVDVDVDDDVDDVQIDDDHNDDGDNDADIEDIEDEEYDEDEDE